MSVTLDRWPRDRARATPRRTAIVFGDTTISYAELDTRSEHLAAGLLAAGLRPGDRVATLSGNRPEQVELFFGCAKAGLILTPINLRLATAEVAYQLGDARPALLLTAPDLRDTARRAVAASGHAGSIRVEDLTRTGLDRLSASPAPAAETGPESAPESGPEAGPEAGPESGPASSPEAGPETGPRVPPGDDAGLLLVYTSGTTGRPKGALLTHANCFWTNLSLDRGIELREDDVVLQVLPQFHVGGWNVQPLLAWWKGATVVLEPAFDAGRALRLIERRRITTMMGVPATYLFMSRHEAFATADLSSLRRVVVGGAPMPEPLLRTWLDRGVEIIQGYGLTEAAPNVLCLPADEVAARVGWAGKPYPHVDVALLDTGDGRPIDGPGRGELVVRGPNVFPGYWRDAAASEAAVPDGWLRTGDIAERDADGFYRLRDRLKDMYVSGGENVYPAEVESVLAECDEVAEAAVVGVPDERWGEAGCAFVVAKDTGARLSAETLRAHCRDRLAGFKVPKHVRQIDELPRSAVDKVLKDELRTAWKPS